MGGYGSGGNTVTTTDLKSFPLVTYTREVDTISSDGKRILFNPDFYRSLTPGEVQQAIVHEYGHIGDENLIRMGAMKARGKRN